MTTDCFVIVDTESSVCRESNMRILVSLAYEVVDGEGSVRHSQYDLVALPPAIHLDRRSQRIHGITPDASVRRGRALYAVLWDFLDHMETARPCAIVGHDVVADAALLVSEALRVGFPAARLRTAFVHLLCTKQLAVGHCGIPLPPHLRYDFPCDLVLRRLNGSGADRRHHAAVPQAVTYKWPSLFQGDGDVCDAHRPGCDECYHLLVEPDGATDRTDGGAPPPAELYPCHDARGDVQRCRLVFTRLLTGPPRCCGP